MFDLFDINILDIILFAAALFGGWTMPQPNWAQTAWGWLGKLIFRK